MGALTPWPQEVGRIFREKYAVSPETATDWFYGFCQDTNYIRRDRTARDLKWTTETEYGALEITVNLAKPEKDPLAIAAAANAGSGQYPACQLCMENEGYAGRPDYPARENLRIVPLTLCGENWGFQYSPYVYYNEHCIVMQIQMVGGLVQQQDVRVLQKETGKIDAGLFPAGETVERLGAHAHHGVHKGQPRRGKLRQIHQHIAKVRRPGMLKVELGFPRAGQDAEEIFHAAGEAHQPVGLELTQIDHAVGLEQPRGDGHRLYAHAAGQGARFLGKVLVQRRARPLHDPHTRDGVDVFQLCGGKRSAGRIAKGNGRAPRHKHPAQLRGHRRMHRGGGFGLVSPDQIAFDRNGHD